MNSFKRKVRIDKLDDPTYYFGAAYNVKVLVSPDNGETWWYGGIGKYTRTLEEAYAIAQNYLLDNGIT